MANTFIKIASVTVGSGGSSSIVFNSIPQTYTDLILKLSGRTTDGGFYTNVITSINNQTSGKWRNMYGYTGNAYAGSSTIIYSPSVPGSTATTSFFGNSEMYFSNYTNSLVKGVLVVTPVENNSTVNYLTEMASLLLTNGTAINTITLTANFAQYSTATLYGIKSS